MVDEPIFLDLSSSSDEDDDDHVRSDNESTALLYLAKVFHVDMDEDDVRIIDKPSSNGTIKRLKKPRVARATLDDDDCCILDTDPGAADAAPDVVSSLNSDELVMTGEKGPVACRDFPHARYLCVRFPFKSTLHSKFCAQCHCYVCDSLAPCSLWGEGNSPSDHCHASEEPRWKSLRKIAKYGSVTSFAVPASTGAATAAGESRMVQTTLIQTFPACAPPITPVNPPTQVVPRVATTVKRDPLVIQLKGKGRGKASQHPGMQISLLPGVRRNVNLPRSAPRSTPPPPPPSGIAADDESPLATPNPNSSFVSGFPTPSLPPLASPNPNFRPVSLYASPHPSPLATSNPISSLRGGFPTTSPPPLASPNPNFRYVPSTATPYPSPLATPNPNSSLRGGFPTTSPPPLASPNLNFRHVPSTPTPHSRSTRNVKTFSNRVGGAVAASYQDSNTRAMTTEQQFPLPSLNPNSAPAAEAPSPPRYVPASSLREQPEIFRPVENATSGPGFGTFDILAVPIEGWEMYTAAADFDAFASSASPEHVPSSLHDVIRQMAADDSLWEPPYPGWQ